MDCLWKIIFLCLFGFLHDQGISDSCFGAVRQNKSDTIGKRGVGDKKWSIEPPNNESVKIHLKKIDCKGAALKIDGKKFCKRGTGYYTYRHESCGNSSCIGIGRDNCTATYFPLCIEYKGSETDSFRLSYEFKPCLENGNQISETTQRFDTTTQHQSPPLAEAGTTTQMTSTSERPKDTMTTTSKSPQNCKTDVLYNQSAKIWKTGSSEQCNIWELQRPENMTNDMKLELNITEIQCLRRKFIINEQPFCGNETGVYTFHSTCSGICDTIDRCVKLKKFPLSIKFNTKNKNHRFRLSYQFKPCIDDSKTESQARQKCKRKQLHKELSEIRKYGITEQCTWELHRPENFGNDVKLELNIKESNCRGERLKINEQPFCDNKTGIYTFHSTCGELCNKVDRCQKLEQFPLIITFKTNRARDSFRISYQFKPCSDDSKTATNNTALVIVIPIFVITLLTAFVIIGILLKMRAKSSGNSSNRSNSMELKATNDQQATRQPGNTFRKLPEIPGTESPYEIVGDETELQNNGCNNDAHDQLGLTKNVIQNGEGSSNNKDQQGYNDEENVLVDNVLYGSTQNFTPNDGDA